MWRDTDKENHNALNMPLDLPTDLEDTVAILAQGGDGPSPPPPPSSLPPVAAPLLGRS